MGLGLTYGAWGDDNPDAPVPDAAELEAWARVQRALVDDSIDGDAEGSVRRYSDLVHNRLTAGDPNLSEALYWLASSQWHLGNIAGAREALDACIRSGLNKARCVDLRSRIDLEQDSIRTVPVTWTFDSPDHGVYHPRDFWDKGSIRLDRGDASTSALVWSTDVDPFEVDELVVGFVAPSPAPTEVRLRVRSTMMTATLAISLQDERGRVYAPQPSSWTLPEGKDVLLVARLDTAVSTDGQAAQLEPATLHRLLVRDVTGQYGNVGRNELRIDELTVR